MPIIVFQHSAENRPGRLGATLRDHGHRLDIRRLDRGDEVPPDFDDVTGVITLGGPQNTDEDYPWMDAELAYLRGAHERQLPVVGVCLGAQLIAAALGGSVAPMSSPEIGYVALTLTPQGYVDTVLAGVAWECPVLSHHAREITTPPEGAAVLGKSEKCGAQVFRAGLRTYGFQYHFEADEAMALEIHRASGDTSVSVAELTAQNNTHYQTFARLADRVCVNIAAHLMPSVRLVGSVGGAG